MPLPGEADGVAGVGEPAHLAELGPAAHGGQPADPLAAHERLAARLAAGDGGRGGVQPVELGVQELDRAKARSVVWRATVGSSRRASQARPWVVRSQERSGRPWWYRTAWMRCCQAVR